MPLLGYKDASTELGLPIGTLYSLVSQHRIPHVRLGRRLVRFDRDQLAAWIVQHRVAVVKSEDTTAPTASDARKLTSKKRGGK